MTQLNLTIKVLKNLKQPYKINKKTNTLIIKPTSSPMLDCLPGKFISNSDSTELHIDLQNGPFIDHNYISIIIKELASYL